MNAELFSEAMSLIDESYITEALNYRPQEKALPAGVPSPPVSCWACF